MARRGLNSIGTCTEYIGDMTVRKLSDGLQRVLWKRRRVRRPEQNTTSIYERQTVIS